MAVGIMHSFSGSLEDAKRFMQFRHDGSLRGRTFKKRQIIQEAAKELPLTKFMETDAPYLVPVPKAWPRNKTAYTRYVVDFIAELRGCTRQKRWHKRPMTMRERYLALTEKKKIPEVIAVEGKDDTANLETLHGVGYSQGDTYSFAINQDDLERITQELRESLSYGIQITMGSGFVKSSCKKSQVKHAFKSWRSSTKSKTICS